MLGFLRRLADMRTVRTLCERAEMHARARGEAAPGAEHFLLAAFDLPDGAAARVFARLRVDPAAISHAIEEQYRSALAQVGLAVLDGAPAVLAGEAHGLYRAQGSARTLMQLLAGDPALRRGRLSGAHVLAALARAEQGVAARTLRVLGIERHALQQAAAAEISAA